MAEHGGYRRPANPAPEGSSGPGKFSKRTDGGPSVDNAKQAAQYISGQDYGQGQEINSLAHAMPLSAAPSADSATQISSPAPMPTAFNAPTERPNEPVTHGSPVGPGANSIPQIQQATNPDSQKTAIILGMLQNLADTPDASEATRNMVRRLRGMQ